MNTENKAAGLVEQLLEEYESTVLLGTAQSIKPPMAVTLIRDIAGLYMAVRGNYRNHTVLYSAPTLKKLVSRLRDTDWKVKLLSRPRPFTRKEIRGY